MGAHNKLIIPNRKPGFFIFRQFIKLDKYFVVKRNLDVEKVAASFGIKTYRADNADSLYEQLSNMMVEDGPAVLVVKTDGKRSAEILKNYFKPIK